MGFCTHDVIFLITVQKACTTGVSPSSILVLTRIVYLNADAAVLLLPHLILFRGSYFDGN